LKVLFVSELELNVDEPFNIMTGVYNRVVKEFVNKPLSFTLQTYVDAPPGSGLGSSSTLVVSILGAFAEWLFCHSSAVLTLQEDSK